jgi:hypothetical protein
MFGFVPDFIVGLSKKKSSQKRFIGSGSHILFPLNLTFFQGSEMMGH